MRDLLDRQLGRITMYRLVTIVLGLLVVVMLAYTAAGTFKDPFTVEAELITLVVLLAASYASNRVFGLIWRITPHTESSIITALLLFFIFWPSTDVADLGWLAAAAVLANASKYVLAWRGRHVFNPAAAGALLVVIVQGLVGRDAVIGATWWIASEKLLPYVVVAALLVLWRTRRLDVAAVFVVVGVVFTLIGLNHQNGGSLATVFNSFAFVFMAGFMVTEPLTLPPRRVQQWVVAAVTGFVMAWPLFTSVVGIDPISIGVVGVTPELSLLVGNLVAFAFARRRGLTFELVENRQLTPETYELTFQSKRPVSFTPGQFMELSLPHAGTDSRGSRRTFSISSAPNADGAVSFALRVPQKSSSFKRALLALKPGHRVHGTGVGGDFVLPADPTVPVVLVAGGIGITPFLSQLRHAADRDAVLIYGASSPDEVPFTEDLADAPVVLVCPVRPDALPASWTFVEAPYLSADAIAAAVPDLAVRRAYISGPPQMVNALRSDLKKRCKAVKTDYFTGY